MPKFRKRPVIIEALHLTVDNLEAVEAWCKGSIKGTSLPRNERVIDIYTLQGEVRADLGDWIIKGVEGEFYPCKPSIFEKTYEEVEELRPLPTDPEILSELPEECCDDPWCLC